MADRRRPRRGRSAPYPTNASDSDSYWTAAKYRAELSAMGIVANSSLSRKHLKLLYEDNVTVVPSMPGSGPSTETGNTDLDDVTTSSTTSAPVTTTNLPSTSASLPISTPTYSPGFQTQQGFLASMQAFSNSMLDSFQRCLQQSIQSSTAGLHQTANAPPEHTLSSVYNSAGISSFISPTSSSIPAAAGSPSQLPQTDGPFPFTGSRSIPSACEVSTVLRSHLELNQQLNSLLQRSICPRTRVAYTTGFNTFCSFLIKHGIQVSVNRLPAISEEILVFFVTFCFNSMNLSPSTIKLYLCGIRFYYVNAGCSNPLECTPGQMHARLRMVLLSIKKSSGKPTRTRQPITFDILSQICERLDKGVFSHYLDTLLKAVCCSALFGFMRCGEFTIHDSFDPSANLSLDDLTFAPHCAYLRLKTSKTDPLRIGVTIQLHKTDHAVCPYLALCKYIKLRRLINHTPSALFTLPDGTPLSRSFFIQNLKYVLRSIGLQPENFNGHSFRIGAATSAGKAKVEPHLIQALGRWSSDCYIRYIRVSQDVIKNAQKSLICHG